jgi:SAM-dependent methyltransferase
MVHGVPILLVEGSDSTLWVMDRTRELTGAGSEDEYLVQTLGCSDEERDTVQRLLDEKRDWPIDPVVNYMVCATNGILYGGLVGKLERYPIPELRLPPGDGKTFLDIGCNWGRWCVAAARKGYQPIGIDPSVGAVLAAQRVCRQLGVSARFAVADARRLPFAHGVVDCVFSYSVLQHFSRKDARESFVEIGRVLRNGGAFLIQMPNRWGVRCLQHQARRRFREGEGFEVRYWGLRALRELTEASIGPLRFEVDGFFGLGIQGMDRELMPTRYRAVIAASDFLQTVSRKVPFLTRIADSVYLRGVKSGTEGSREAGS